MTTEYHLQTKGYTDEKEISNVSSSTSKPYKTLGSAIEAILNILEYQSDDIAEVLICNEIGTAVYSVRPTGTRQFHLRELF